MAKVKCAACREMVEEEDAIKCENMFNESDFFYLCRKHREDQDERNMILLINGGENG